MLAGGAGVGKTQLVSGLLASLPTETHPRLSINFNYYTDSRALQAAMEAPLEKKAGAHFGPPGAANRLIFFLDDLNLPALDRYNTQPAVELLRQALNYGAWFDRAKLSKRTAGGLQFIAALNPAAGSFEVNPRLQRHFTTLAVAPPGPAALHTILSTFVEGHLRSWPFGEEVVAAGKDVVAAALQLHAAVGGAFRKSAACFHYEFTLRHLAGVVGGLLAARPSETFRDARSLVLLWLHESERVYGDRLVSNDDLGRYRGLAAGLAKKKFPAANTGQFFGEAADPLVFTPFGDGGGSAERPYERVPTLEALRGRVEEGLREYNEANPAMDLVLFPDALRHVGRIARILAAPGGHALLVGVGGSGKQSLARLAASMLGYRVVSITITGSYGCVGASYRIASCILPVPFPVQGHRTITALPGPLPSQHAPAASRSCART
jgi:dynein heavy chain